jgi:hypothetical protein
VFTAPIAGGLRDPNNVSGDLRQLLDARGQGSGPR